MSVAEATEVQQQPQLAAAPPSAVENVTTAVAKFDRVAAGIGELATKFKGVLFEVATTKGMKEACAARLAIREPRYEVERVRKECKAPILALGKDIDARAAKIEAELLALEEPIDKQIKAEEARKLEEKRRKEEAEATRIRLFQARLAHIRGFLLTYARQSAASIEEGIRSLVAIPVDATFQEFEKEAAELHADVLGKLREMHAAQLAHEAEQQRLKLEREELARKTQEQEAANAKERERIAAEQAEAKRKADAAEAERQRNIEAQMAQLKAERMQREREDAERAERQRLEDEARAAEQRQAQEELQRQQAQLDAQRAELERQQAELAKPSSAPLAANTQLEGDFTVAYDVVEIPAAGDVYEPAQPMHIEAAIDIGPAAAPRAHFKDEEAERMLAEAQLRLGIPVIFTRYELSALAASPDALQVIIDWHDYQESCADGFDCAGVADHHEARRKQLMVLQHEAAVRRQKEVDG